MMLCFSPRVRRSRIALLGAHARAGARPSGAHSSPTDRKERDEVRLDRWGFRGVEEPTRVSRPEQLDADVELTPAHGHACQRVERVVLVDRDQSSAAGYPSLSRTSGNLRGGSTWWVEHARLCRSAEAPIEISTRSSAFSFARKSTFEP